MTINIPNHDPTIRYRIFIQSGGVRKTVHVPVGVKMPLTWHRKGANDIPLRPGVATGWILPYGGEKADFSFNVPDDCVCDFSNAAIEVRLGSK